MKSVVKEIKDDLKFIMWDRVEECVERRVWGRVWQPVDWYVRISVKAALRFKTHRLQ